MDPTIICPGDSLNELEEKEMDSDDFTPRRESTCGGESGKFDSSNEVELPLISSEVSFQESTSEDRGCNEKENVSQKQEKRNKTLKEIEDIIRKVIASQFK